MDADILATEGARVSTNMILTMSNRVSTPLPQLAHKKRSWVLVFIRRRRHRLCVTNVFHKKNDLHFVNARYFDGMAVVIINTSLYAKTLGVYFDNPV